MKPVAILVAASFVAGTGLLVWAQDSPTIRVTTRLVQVNVIVRDKNGPVSNLQKEDFTLLEKGKERQIASFSMTAVTAPPPAQAGMKMPPNIFSNRFDRAAAAPSTMTVIMIDGMNTNLLDQVLVRRSAMEVLRALKPEDRVALYMFGTRGLRVLHDFTNDFDELRAAIQRTKGEQSGQLVASDSAMPGTGSDTLDGMWQEQNDQSAIVSLADRARRTTDALAAIGRHIAIIPGRKNLIWVSGSFPIGIGNDLDVRARANSMPSASRSATPATQKGGLPDVDALAGLPDAIPTLGFGGLQSPQQFTDEIQKSWRALNQANVAVYPVDAKGLLAQDVLVSPTTKTRFIIAPSGIDTMRLLADRTGGKAFFNTNDLTGAMRSAIDDGKVSYTLGFYPQASELDGKFHEIKVKVARSGVDVRHRTGYTALDDAPRTEKQIEEDLRSAATRPLDITEVGVSARADLLKPTDGGGAALRVAVSIDLSDVRVEKKADRWVGKLELFVFQVGPNGLSLDSTTAAIPLNLTEADYRAAAQEGMVVSKTLKPAAGVQQVRVLVLDRMSGKIGSLRMPMGPIIAASEKKSGAK